MTIEEIERVCDASEPQRWPSHELEAPDLQHCETFYPLGFPTELRTNSIEILAQARNLWSGVQERFHTQPIRVDLHVVEAGSKECPAPPASRIVRPNLISVANKDNYSIANLDEATTQIVLSHAAEKHINYLNYFFLEPAPLHHIAAQFTTPIHAGCVSLDGKGVLLCGDSGAGKSSLSYACARSGWTYVTDDASYMLHDAEDRRVTGHSRKVRFRPSAGELFPEVNGLDLTPRAAGKPSIEVPTDVLPKMICAQTALVDYIVFLNRHSGSEQQLVPFRTEVARHYMRQVLYGSAQSRVVQHAAIERLLTAEIFELRYTDLDWGVPRLEALIRDGC